MRETGSTALAKALAAMAMTVAAVMPILFTVPFPLLNVPRLRLIVAGADHSDRSSGLFSPLSQIFP
jgi:hypothetical protein